MPLGDGAGRLGVGRLNSRRPSPRPARVTPAASEARNSSRTPLELYVTVTTTTQGSPLAAVAADLVDIPTILRDPLGRPGSAARLVLGWAQMG